MRKMVLGNGNLVVCVDENLLLREMYWPVAGLWNHVQDGRESGLFISVDGQYLPVGGPMWEMTGELGPGMAYRWKLRNEELGMSVAVADSVDPYLPVWARRVNISFEGAGSVPPQTMRVGKPVGLYSVQAFALCENTAGECAAYDANARRLYHFKGPVWAAMKFAGKDAAELCSVGKVRDGGVRREGTVAASAACAPAVEHGLVESCLGLRWEGGSDLSAEFMLSFGGDRAEADRNLTCAGKPDRVRKRSERSWSGFRPGNGLSQTQLDTPALAAEDRNDLLRENAVTQAEIDATVLALAAHCDRAGGILAAYDTDIMGDFRDHYRYVWPRDAALCAGALLRAGYPEYAARFLDFCRRAITPQGFFWQRYRPDGTRGSTWHPWDCPAGTLPIQEDETAFPLILAGEYLAKTGDLDTINAAYGPFIRLAADFVLRYTVDAGVHVRASYDMWEERRGVYSATQAACAGALAAAAGIAGSLGYAGDKRRFMFAAKRLLEGLLEGLSNPAEGFWRGLGDKADDSSLFMIPLALPTADQVDRGSIPLVEEALRRSAITWTRQRSSLAVPLPGAGAPGFARYRGDWYCRPEGAGDKPGNPWPVCAGYYALAGVKLGKLGRQDVGQYLEWFRRAKTNGGLLPEQFDCVTGRPRSVCPLAWSEAVFLDVLTAGRGL